MITAIGDCALVRQELPAIGSFPRQAELLLVGAEGVRARFADVQWEDVRTLAHPPRLAIHRRRSQEVDVIDVATGDVQETYEDLLHVARWSPTGSALYAFDRDGHCLVKSGGFKTRIGGMEREAADWAWFSSDETRVLTFSRDADDTGLARVAGFDLVDGHRLFAFTSAAQHMQVSDDATLFTLENPYELRFYDVATLDDSSTNARRESAYVGVEQIDLTHMDRTWTNDALTTFVVAGAGGALVTLRRRALAFDVVHRASIRADDVDVDRGLVLRSIGDDVAVFDLSGSQRARASNAFNATLCNGRAVCVINGAVHELRDGGAVVVEGPANVLDIGPHARGVIALDSELRAHVLELPP